MAMVEMRSHTVVVVANQREHMLKGLDSRSGWDGSSNWDYMGCCIGHWLMACIVGPQHWHA